MSMEETKELNELKQTLAHISRKLDNHDQLLAQLMGHSALPSRPPHHSIKPAPHTAPSKNKTGEIEQAVGVRWLGWIGFFSFIVGVGLFLRYAFEQGWITEFGRVVLGYVGGALLFGVGAAIRKKYSAYGNVIQGIGVAIFYLVTFAAFNFYHLINQGIAFAILALITAAVASWGLRTNAPVLMGASFLGAYLTPLLIHESASDPRWLLFPYLLALNVALFLVSRKRQEPSIPLIGLGGTLILWLYWSGIFYREELALFTILWLFAFSALFSAGRFVVAPVRPWRTIALWDWLPVVLIPAAIGSTLIVLDDADIVRSTQGFILLGYVMIQGIHLCGSYLFAKSEATPTRISFAVLIFAALAVIAKFIPLWPFEQALAFGIEALIVFGLGIWLKRPEVRIGALVLLLIGVLKTTAVDFPPPASFTPLFTQAFEIRFLLLAIAVIMAILYRRAFKSLTTDEQNSVVPAFFVLTNVGALWLFSSEIARWFNAQYKEQLLNTARRETRKALLQQFTNQRNIAISIFWGLYGIGALVFGFLKKSKLIRLGSLILLIATILKVFLYDFWALGTVYRMIVSLALGVVFLLGAFLYHRFADRIKHLIRD